MKSGAGTWAVAGIAFLSCLLLTAPLWACSVPVFRYALENWQSDNYELVVFHRGPLSAEQQSAVDNLAEDRLVGVNVANAVAHTVDLAADPASEAVKFWESQQTKTLPWMVLRSPKNLPTVWTGPLTDANLEQILDSPLRREIARRILKGESAVWILLESGNKKEDDDAFKLLEAQLAYQAANLKLPEIEEVDLDQLSVDPDSIRISFSVLRLARDNKAESMFIEMLLGTEDDLREFNKPIAFPMFGRGRALYALVGDGINDDTIRQACSDLTGACECTVKAQTPGTDVVMNVDWENLVVPQSDIDQELPPLPGAGSLFADAGNDDSTEDEAAIETGTENGGAEDKPSGDLEVEKASTPTAVVETEVLPTIPDPTGVEKRMSAVLRNAMIVIGFGIAAIVGVSLFLAARKN
jgi:hypothetical protein